MKRFDVGEYKHSKPDIILRYFVVENEKLNVIASNLLRKINTAQGAIIAIQKFLPTCLG